MARTHVRYLKRETHLVVYLVKHFVMLVRNLYSIKRETPPEDQRF